MFMNYVFTLDFVFFFLYLNKLYYPKALSDQASSLAPDWIPLLWRPRIPVSFTALQQPFKVLVGHLHVFFGKMHIQILFCPFVYFLLLSCMCFLYILDINHLLNIWFASIFPLSVGWAFVLMIISLSVQQLSSLMQFHLFILYIFFPLSLESAPQNITEKEVMSVKYLPIFSSRKYFLNVKHL